MVTDLFRVFLLVSDLERSVAFYRELLGRAPTNQDAQHARFDLDRISVTVHQDLAGSEASAWHIDPVPERRGWGVYLTFATDDLEHAFGRLAQIGAEILIPPRAAPWATRMLIAKDPDGYLLELSERG
jgi:catechol 2,3-dioxygenase-like lactoylglutathione lyase family enzyme